MKLPPPPKQFRGCGAHGFTDDMTRKKWNAWCLKCNPPPSAALPLSDGQKVARKLDRNKGLPTRVTS